MVNQNDAGTVLVTGASGFIGRHLVALLAREGARVVGVARRSPDVDGLAESCATDLSNADATRELICRVRPSSIFHLASLVSGSRDRSVVVPMLEANLSSTVHLLDAATEVGCGRFVQVGSLEEPSIAAPPAAPVSPYAAAKYAATHYCRMFGELYELPIVLARVFMVYGPGPQDEKKLVPYVVRSLLEGKDLELGAGTREVDWIYVEDVARGLVAAASVASPRVPQIELGSGVTHSVRAVVETIYEQLGRNPADAPFGSRESPEREVVRVADVAGATRDAGWVPEVCLEDGLASTIAWFRNPT